MVAGVENFEGAQLIPILFFLLPKPHALQEKPLTNIVFGVLLIIEL
jgi:hypothetical protein